MRCRKFAALAMLLLLCAALLALPLAEVFHDCPGEDCPVCAALAEVRSAWRSLALPVWAALGLVLAAGVCLAGQLPETPSPTPVALRVKLTN